MLWEAGNLALTRGFDDAVNHHGPAIVWGDRVQIAAHCEDSGVGQAVTCLVRFDEYPDRDRWCLIEYSVAVPSRSLTASQPSCGTFSGDGDPLPPEPGSERLPLDRHQPPL